ncbi:MAG: transposase [Candidatus Hadarchaeota archaeon]|nr:transposase [Candidatus Hadarchaeota archaeon]
MKRTNTFSLAPTEKQHEQLLEIADACARLWNELNYRRRQSFFKGKINWESRDLYDKYKGTIGSATAQQVQRKNSEAWKSFFALLKLKIKGKLPPHIQKVRPPRYWKNRSSGKRKLLILIRCDCYGLEAGTLKLPKKLKIEWKGKPKWGGWVRQGLLTLIYDSVRQKWYARQMVEVEPPHQPLSDKRAYVDLGVLELLTVAVDGKKQALAYSGRRALADWWYLSHRIDGLKSVAMETNGKQSTKRIRGLFRRRTLRFKQYVNTVVRRAIERLWQEGVSEIVVGDLKDIRVGVNGGRKSNAMVHNFWSHRYLIWRIREVAEEHGISVVAVNERGTSSRCPWCGSEEVVKRGRLLRCKECGIEAHRDVAGALNIGAVHNGGYVNGAMAHPLEVRI